MTADTPDAAGVAGSTDVCASARWSTQRRPQVAVHLSTHDRAAFLPDLIAHLEAQEVPMEHYEVVVVDDASTDDTWPTLCRLVDRTDMAMLALRHTRNAGQAAGRNTAVAATSAPLLAFTDDDCLPQSGWLAAILGEVDHDVIQGRTEPAPSGTATGAWDRTIHVGAETPLFETCNIAYRREAFEAAGGFDEGAPTTGRAGRHSFGEDVVLGAAVIRAGGRRVFVDDAVVVHRYLPTTYRQRLRLAGELSGFPALVRRSEVLRRALVARTFLSTRTLAFDAAAASLAVGVGTRRPIFLVGVLPWVRLAWPDTRSHAGRAPLVRLAQLAAIDAAGAVALVRGSLRHRRLVL